MNPAPAPLPRLYLITDHGVAGARAVPTLVAEVLAALAPGAALVQLRAKHLDPAALLALARELREITAARGCPLLVNDRLDVALAAGADGVHLPERGLDPATVRALAGPAFLIGASTHSPAGAARAAHAGADLIVCGPIWATPSKPGAPTLGLDGLGQAARAVAATNPAAHLFALGGADTPERARAARAAGAHGVAGIRAFAADPEPGPHAAALARAVDEN
ncbi:thiamine phosphate synthase [Haliangium sp.]|uniref:thiamine phosphate synthase n=1 Tax=Haliangium sp. TaxID=2663208 RepID=UPI003D139E9D